MINRGGVAHDGSGEVHDAIGNNIAEVRDNDGRNEFDTVKQLTEDSGRPIERSSEED